MRKKFLSLTNVTIMLAIINYLVVYQIDVNEVTAMYKILIIGLIFILRTDWKKHLNFKQIIILLIALISPLVRFVNTDYMAILGAEIIYYYAVVYLIIEMNNNMTTDTMTEVIDLLCLPIKIIAFAFKSISYFFKSLKDFKLKANKQVFLGIICAIPVILITGILFSLSDLNFHINLDIIFEGAWSLFNALSFTAVWFYFRNNKYQYDSQAIEIGKLTNDRFSKYTTFANAMLCSIIPLQIFFIGFEFRKLLVPEEVYGVLVANAYMLIMNVVVINLIIMLIFYYFYQDNNLIAKIIRNILLVSNYLLLIISTSQIIMYINNFNALTEKRYYGLVLIILMLLLNMMMHIKTNWKQKDIRNALFLYLFIIFSLFIVIDKNFVIEQFNDSRISIEVK